MEIIIRGERAQGKSTLALLVESFLRQKTPFVVTRGDDAPDRFDRPYARQAENLEQFIDDLHLTSRTVNIKVENSR